MLRIAFSTIGCKVNQYETEAMAEQCEERGYRLVPFPEEAEIYVINTCAVTKASEQRSRQVVRQAIRRNPKALVAVTGCHVQAKPEDFQKIEGVGLIIGNLEKGSIAKYIEEAQGGRALVKVSNIRGQKEFSELRIKTFHGRTRALVKIQDGCDSYCSYCTIPYLRGPSRSRKLEEIIAEVENLTNSGYKEIVLTGIRLGAYGSDLSGDLDLVRVIKTIEPLKGVRRIRLSSIEPTDITEDLLKHLLSSPKLCRHLHIPLQSGDDEILRAMNRRYRVGEYESLVERIRELSPGMAVTTDIMVGFPGEEEGHFENTYRAIDRLNFSKVHIFKYSPRPGTSAFKLKGSVEARVCEERAKRLGELSLRKSLLFREKFLGETLEVLVEERRDRKTGLLTGLTDNYIRVIFEGPDHLRGELVKIKVIEVTFGHTLGVLAQ